MTRTALLLLCIWLSGCAVRHASVSAPPRRPMTTQAGGCLAPGRFCVEVDPESGAVLKALNMRDLIEYDVLACNRTGAPRTVPIEMIKMAITDQAYALGIPPPHFVDAGRATNLLTYHQSKSTASVIATWAYRLGLAGMAVMAGPWIKAGSGAFEAVAFFTVGSRELQGVADAAVPQLTPYLNTMLGAAVTLGPDQCVTGSMFAGPTPNPQAIQGVIQ